MFESILPIQKVVNTNNRDILTIKNIIYFDEENIEISSYVIFTTMT